ncbi:dnaJ homolog subfamily C member 28 isoform X1 [Ixodes scapularis]
MAIGDTPRVCVSTENQVLISSSLKRSYRLLGLEENCSLQELKDAFIRLARKYHPDSGTATADAAKFDEIKTAYHSVRDHLLEGAPSDHDDVNAVLEKNFGIKHTVPQHRQYLSFDGVGSGTPTQRWHQYQQHRVQQAVNRVYEHQTGKSAAGTKERTLVLKDATLARQYKTTQAIERLVEDLIQESIARGEFNNLPGSGKPLKFAPENPYVDSTTQKLNQVLIANGYVPEWVMLEREIREEKEKVRTKLRDHRAQLGCLPLSGEEKQLWDTVVQGMASSVTHINRKIDKFNMVVPLFNKQQLHFQLVRESEKILNSAAPRQHQSGKKRPINRGTEEAQKDFFSFLLKVIKIR